MLDVTVGNVALFLKCLEEVFLANLTLFNVEFVDSTFIFYSNELHNGRFGGIRLNTQLQIIISQMVLFIRENCGSK